ncbi:MAG: hypothetical protein Q8R58_04345 [Sulfuricurvum sp.]|nr:hypothetical protein [Sulfuricurvum sp.]
MNKPTKYTNKTLDSQLREGELRAVLRSTTNHGMSHYQGITGSLYVNTQAYWYGRDRDETFRTSMLKDYALDGKRLTLYTLNSTYVFEILQGEFDVFLFTRAPKALIQHQDLLNSTPCIAYYCQIMGNALIDNAISITILPTPMTRQEAIDYAAANILRDTGGDIVKNILSSEPRIKKDNE